MADNRIVTLKAIAVHLGVAPTTAREWALRRWDPLPLLDVDGQPAALRDQLDEWTRRGADLAAWRARRPRGMPGELIVAPDRIVRGWRRILPLLGPDGSVDTAQARAGLQFDPLPIIGFHCPWERIPATEGAPPCVWAYASAIRDWLFRHTRPYRERRRATPQLALFEE